MEIILMKTPSPQRNRSFRDLSREFLEREARCSFLIELLLFGLIVAISAWPLFTVSEALSQSMR
jgi:hypothetical protein